MRTISATAADTMAAVDDSIAAALAAQPVELPKPDGEFQPYLEMVNGVLLVVTRGQDGMIRMRAECEFRSISADLLPYQALAARQRILDMAFRGAGPDAAEATKS